MRDTDYIVVVGGVNIDICGKSTNPLIPCDSNPGTVRLSLGGVGRNIAHNLALLGAKVKLLTALGDDLYAQQVRESCDTLGIDLSHARTVPNGATSTYLVLTQPDGDVALALCDAEISHEITPAYLQEKLDVLNGAKAVVVETNLTQEALGFLAEHCTAPIYADPVSVTKAEKLRPILPKLCGIKPNKLETELLTGLKIQTDDELEQAAERLLQMGVRQVFISLGGEGLLCASAGERIRIPCFPTSLKNATGGGDAMMAALVRGISLDLPMQDAARLSLAAGAIAVESEETINPTMSLSNAAARAGINI